MHTYPHPHVDYYPTCHHSAYTRYHYTHPHPTGVVLTPNIPKYLYLPPPQAKEKQAQLEHDKVQEEDDNFTEVCNHVNGDLLTENPDVAQSAFGPHRVIPDRWKGMSPSQLDEIRTTQEFQRQEKEVCGFHRVSSLVSQVYATRLACFKFSHWQLHCWSIGFKYFKTTCQCDHWCSPNRDLLLPPFSS